MSMDAFLGFVGGVKYLVSYNISKKNNNLYSDCSGEERGQFNKSHGKAA